MPAFRVDADATNATGTLGVCNIKDPTYDRANDNIEPAIHPSEYNRVYFGWVPATPTGKVRNRSDSSYTDVDPYNNGTFDMTNTPIYWRVLNTKANNNASTPALFILTEYTLNGISWDLRYYNNGGNQRWQFTQSNKKETDSSLRKFLQGSSCSIPLSHNIAGDGYTAPGLYDECFTPKEQDVILATTKTETSNDNITLRKTSDTILTGKACNLDQEKIFLLSASEVTEEKYGFEGSRALKYANSHLARDVNRITKKLASTGYNYNWWLRSASSYPTYSVATVSSPGNPNYYDSYMYYSVRFALNLPLSRVIFAQDASVEGASPSPTFVTIPTLLTRTKFKYSTTSDADPVEITSDNNDSVKQFAVSLDKTIACAPGAKLTIADQTRTNSFKVTNFENISELSAGSGRTINLHYEGAVTQDQSSDGTEYISAIIKEVGTNQNNTGTGIYGGNGLYYARLKPVGDSTSGDVSMTIPRGLEEDTTYTLIVYNELDRGKYKTNYAGYDTITLHVYPSPPELTSVYKNESGNNLKLNISGGNLSHISTLLGEKIMDIAGNDTTKNLYLDENNTGITVYDHRGYSTSLYTNDVAIDKTPPIVTITRSDGKYTLTVSDNESGVWKITNGDGTKVYHDYS